MTTLLAWVTDENIKAVRTDDGTELLVVDGRVVPLTAADFHPTQQVINYCHLNKREKRQRRAFWAAMGEGA